MRLEFRCTTDFTFPRAGRKPKVAHRKASEAAPWAGFQPAQGIARLGYRLPYVGLIAIDLRAKERILEENSKRAGVLRRGFEANLYIFKQISQYLMKSFQLYQHPVCHIQDSFRGALTMTNWLTRLLCYARRWKV